MRERKSLDGVPDAPVPQRPLTPSQLANYLQVSPSTIARQMREGLPHLRIGGRVLFLAEDVIAYYRSRAKP